MARPDLDSAVDIATRLEQAASQQEILGELIWREADKHEGLVRDLLRLDAAVLLLDAAKTEQIAQWGQPLVPTRVIDGEPFQLEDIPDGLEQFAELRAASRHPEVAGRWNDVRWLRWRRFPAVVPAVDGYLATAEAIGVGDARSLERALAAYRRAAELALRLDVRRPEVGAAARKAISAWAATDYPVFVRELVDATADVLSADPGETKRLAEELYEQANTSTVSIGGRELLAAAERLARAGGAEDLATDARRARAASFEREAGERDGLARIVLLRDAVDLYQQVGDSAAVDRLRVTYAEAGQQALTELRPVEGTVPIERRAIEAAVDRLRLGGGPSLAGYLALPFELGILDAWATVRQDRQKEDAQHPLLALFGRVSLEADGRVQPEPDPERDREEYEAARDAAFFGRQSQVRAGIFQALYLYELRNRGSWSAPLLAAAISAVDADLAQACFPGFVRYEAGDDWNAAHSLVPQLERVLRALGRLVGADQMRFGRNEALRWASMDVLLDDAGIVRALGDDRVGALKALYIDPHGPNWRNNVAHGALAVDTPPAALATVSILAILAVCYFAALARQEQDRSEPDGIRHRPE